MSKWFFNIHLSLFSGASDICTGIPTLTEPNGNMAISDHQKAKLLNTYFSSVFSTEKNLHTIPNIDDNSYESLNTIDVTEDLVYVTEFWRINHFVAHETIRIFMVLQNAF